MKSYDVVFGMGAACSCSQALREAGLQLASFPFDWMGGKDPAFKAQLMVDDFPRLFEAGTLTRLPEPKFSTHAWYRDQYGFTPLHDFSISVPLEQELPIVREKYRRRIDRLSGLLDSASSALVVYVESEDFEPVSSADALKAQKILSQRWPKVSFDILFVKFLEGVGFSDRHEEQGDGWRIVGYDYKDTKEEEWRADWRQIGAWLRTEYAVVDYRTEEEKKQWLERQKAKKYGRYHATNWWSYQVTKFQYKVYKHLRTRLDRKGII